MTRFAFLALMASTTPALAAKGPFFSLANTDFIVVIGFAVFIGILIYFKVPAMIANMLDSRATGIQSQLDEAAALRAEAEALLAEYKRKQDEVQTLADEIVANAKADAMRAAEDAKADLANSIARRLTAAEDQIASANAAAIKDVREQAISVAIAAAGDVIAKGMTAPAANKLIDAAITEVEAKLH